MQKSLLNIIIVGFLLIVTGCQSNPSNHASSFNNPFNAPFTPQMDLSQSVQEALMRNDDLAIARVHVETRQNTVVLSGYVKKIRQSDTAEQIARQVPGVQSVENRIIIRP